jgi:hypothetical protein
MKQLHYFVAAFLFKVCMFEYKNVIWLVADLDIGG